VTHRYAGLTSASAIGAARTITAVAAGQPDINDSELLTLLVPKARVLVPGSGDLVESTKALGNVFLGASFYDASDGVIEGHQSGWTLDGGSEVLQTPGTGFGVGGCGTRTLSFAARYDSYSPVISGMTYTVRPFVSSAELGSSTSTTVTFSNTSNVGTGFAAGVQWSEKWELVNGSGTVLVTQSASATLGQKTTFTVNKSDIPTTGGKIRLTISMSASDVPTECSAYVTDVYEIPLEKPDPDIVTTLCSAPTTASGSCTLSATSLTGASRAGWTYQWYLDNQLASTQATYSPSFTSAGAHAVRLIATNPFGSGEDTVSLSVAAPPCEGAPPQSSLTFTETPLGGRGRQFDASAFGYTFQDCDGFSWNFGDGSTGTGRSVQHTFAADGTYSVTLAVSNPNGSANVTRSITIGDVAPPPPPPPPPTSCADPTNKVFVNYLGPQSGCKPGLGSPDCFVGEQVQFSVDTYGVTLSDCHSYSWTFSDGARSTSAAPRKSFAAAGNFSVSLAVSNGSVSGTHTTSLTTKSQTCGTTAPSGLTISYFGTTSGCAPNNSTPCKEGEDFIFSIVSGGGYALLGCETIAWDFGDGATSNTNQPRHTFVGTGPFTVTLAVTNTQGTYNTSSPVRFFDPSVPKPVVAVTPASTKAKVGSELHFVGDFQTGSEHPLLAISWRVIRETFGDEVVYTASNTGDIHYTFNEIGDYRVELTATNAGGVSTPAIAYVSVAEVQEYSFLIPVVAHLKGANDTQWRTDLQIFNTDPLKGPIEFEFEFKGGVAPITKTIAMTSSTQIYEDFLAELSKPFPPLEDAGPVVVRARGDSPPQMWTRTYTVDSSGIGSYGQLIPAIPLDSSLQTEDEPVTYVLPGLEISEQFRTNIGIVNPSTETVNVSATARDDSALGFVLGEFQIQVPPLALVQIGDLASRIDGITLGSPFSLSLTTVGNLPIVVYGSMIDQISNDPVYVAGVRNIDQQYADKKVQIVPGAGHLEQANGTWRSDVVVYNDDVLPIHFDLYYFDGSGTRIAEALNQPLGPGAFVRVKDVLKWPSLDTDPGDSFGLIKVETREEVTRYPIIFERTYKDRGDLGSFGQGIPAISPSDANVSLGGPAFIAGVRSDESYYTNLGLIAVGDEPSVVQVTLLHDGSGTPVGTWQYVVDGEAAAINPNASLIVTNIIRAISPLATRGTLKIEVLSGGDVWAYASVIAAADPTCGCSKPEQTFDPEYIPAVKMPSP
jgi:PKD repeat protein